MSKISCEIIKDLLPLYHDEVCSHESRKLVEEHISQCSSCSNELKDIGIEIKLPKETVEKNLSDSYALKDISEFWKRSKVKAFVKGLVGAAVLFTLIFLGFTWSIVSVPADVIKISDVSRLKDGSIDYHYELTDGYISKRSKFNMDDDGNFYITPKRPIFKTKASAEGGTLLTNRNEIFGDFYTRIYKNRYGEDAEIKAIYYGTPKDKVLVWKEGIDLPKASEEVEATYKR